MSDEEEERRRRNQELGLLGRGFRAIGRWCAAAWRWVAG